MSSLQPAPTGNPERPAEWRIVHFQQYSEALDLSGKDLSSLLTHPKEEVSRLIGPMIAKSEMKTEELPGEYVTSLTGELQTKSTNGRTQRLVRAVAT